MEKIFAFCLSMSLSISALGQFNPDDPLLPDHQEALHRMKVPAAWQLSTGNVTIAILSSGINKQVDLDLNVLPGVSFMNFEDTSDQFNMGTLLAGIIAANTNNNYGIAGICPACKIMPFKVQNGDGQSDSVAIAQALMAAADKGIKIALIGINGMAFPSSTLQLGFEYFVNKGGIIFTGIGDVFPVGVYSYLENPLVQFVAATVLDEDLNEIHAPWAWAGEVLQFSAPGIFTSTNYSGGISIDNIKGSHFSAAAVAAIAGLVWSANPNLSAAEVKDILVKTSLDLGTPGKDIYFGHGRIRAYEAVRMAMETVPVDTTPPSAPSNLMAKVGPGPSIVLNWGASMDASGVANYMLYRNGILIAQPMALVYEDKNVFEGKSYSYNIKAIDNTGNISSSSNIATISIAAVDSTPPTVNITSPAAGAELGELVTVSASASDSGGIAFVDFYIDSIFKSRDSVFGYSMTWETTAVANGGHSIKVVATDNAGNTSSHQINVDVNNPIIDTTPPSAPILLSANVLSGPSVSLNWNASSDNVAVAGYRIFRNGIVIAAVGASSLSYLDSNVQYSTSYTYKMIAYDKSGNSSSFGNSITATISSSEPEPTPTPVTITIGDIRVSQITSSSAKISWSTNKSTSGVVAYGTSSVNLNQSKSSGSTGTSHSVSLTGLDSRTTYYFGIKADDGESSTTSYLKYFSTSNEKRGGSNRRKGKLKN